MEDELNITEGEARAVLDDLVGVTRMFRPMRHYYADLA